MLDGLRADHQSSQPGTPFGSVMNVAGFGDSCVCLPAAVPCAAHRRVRWAALWLKLRNENDAWLQTAHWRAQFCDDGPGTYMEADAAVRRQWRYRTSADCVAQQRRRCQRTLSTLLYLLPTEVSASLN